MISVSISDIVKQFGVGKKKLEKITRFIIFPILFSLIVSPIIILFGVLISMLSVRVFLIVIISILPLYYVSLDKKEKYFIKYIRDAMGYISLKILFLEFLLGRKPVERVVYDWFTTEKKSSKRKNEAVLSEIQRAFLNEIKKYAPQEPYNRILTLSFLTYSLVMLLSVSIWSFVLRNDMCETLESYNHFSNLFFCKYVSIAPFALFVSLYLITLAFDIKIASGYLDRPYMISVVETDKEKIIGFIKDETEDYIELHTINLLKKTNNLFYMTLVTIRINRNNIVKVVSYLIDMELLKPIRVSSNVS